jgi:peptidoglycan/xylan/chitin deacetylase (PgdA/CDA1 family)
MRPPTVIYYHQLVAHPRPDHPFLAGAFTPEQFRASMTWIKQRYHPLSMEEMCHIWYHGKRWPARSVVITFDDGFKNNLWAARILRELDMSATFYVISEVVDGSFMPSFLRYAHIVGTRQGSVFDTPTGPVDFGNLLSTRRWTLTTKEHLLSLPLPGREGLLDQLSEIFGSAPIDPEDPDYHFLSASDLREMVDLGMTIGCHTATHEKLSRCSDEELQYQIVESQQKLAELVGQPIGTISYPDGRFDQRVLALAERHFKLGFVARYDLPSNHAYRYPRRRPGADVSRAFSAWYRPRRWCIRVAKRILREPLPPREG